MALRVRRLSTPLPRRRRPWSTAPVSAGPGGWVGWVGDPGHPPVIMQIKDDHAVPVPACLPGGAGEPPRAAVDVETGAAVDVETGTSILPSLHGTPRSPPACHRSSRCGN